MKHRFHLNPASKDLTLKAPHILIATWFGAGFISPAPGTWGSLTALPFGLLILWLGGTNSLLLATVFIFAIGLWSTRIFQKQTGTHDSKMIVIDEVAGQWVTLLFCGLNPLLIALSFLLFRFFDIIKPPPISWIDRKCNDEWGVMLDDILAGIFAALTLLLIKGMLNL